jgi:ferric-dicitrate binding protein FerR (iron transport regulator)
MSSSIPPRDASAQPSTVLRDEDALKRAFLNEYSTLSVEAKTALGADGVALAPKVVEGAFVRAWDARAELKTPEQLNEFLKNDVHHAAARALSRRMAAQRFKGAAPHAAAHDASGEINVDESWARIQSAMHGGEHRTGALAAVAEASRHDAAGHIGKVGKKKSILMPVLIAVVVGAAVIMGMMAMTKQAAKGKVAKAVNSADARVVTTTAGRAGNIDLGDGSVAHMAPESKLTIPPDFSPTLRGLRIEGSATFDVAKGLAAPLQLFARNSEILATGGSFTVSDYPNDSLLTIVVGEGSVDLKHGETPITVAAGTGLVVKDDGTTHVASEVERDEAAGWKSGMLVVNDRSLKDALALMKRWYGYEIRVPVPALLERKVTVRASLDSGMQAIKLVEKSSGLEFGFIGDNMVFREKGSAKNEKGSAKKK